MVNSSNSFFNKFFDDIYLHISEDQKSAILYISYSISGLSLLGSLLILIIYLLNKNLRNFSFLLIINLTISVALQDISKLLSIGLGNLNITVQEDLLCQIEAYLLNYSQLSSLLWSGIISWSLYSTVILVRKKITTDQDRFYLIGFGTPFAISLIPFLSNDYGVYELGCWITAQKVGLRGTIIRNICYYIPLLFGVIINFYLISKIRIYVNRVLPDDPAADFLNRLQWYPFLLFLTLITYIVKAVALFLTDGQVALFIVLVLTTVCVNMLGVFNFIIFGFTKSVKQVIQSKFWEFVGRGESQRESEEVVGENQSGSESGSEKVDVGQEGTQNDFYRLNE